MVSARPWSQSPEDTSRSLQGVETFGAKTKAKTNNQGYCRLSAWGRSLNSPQRTSGKAPRYPGRIERSCWWKRAVNHEEVDQWLGLLLNYYFCQAGATEVLLGLMFELLRKSGPRCSIEPLHG